MLHFFVYSLNSLKFTNKYYGKTFAVYLFYSGMYVRRDENGQRGHTYKLFKTRVRLDMAKFSFGNRVCEQWNHLPSDVVSSSSINFFKGRLDHRGI